MQSSPPLVMTTAMDYMQGIPLRVSVDLGPPCNRMTRHVMKLLSVTVLFFLNHTVTKWLPAQSVAATHLAETNPMTVRPSHLHVHTRLTN